MTGEMEMSKCDSFQYSKLAEKMEILKVSNLLQKSAKPFCLVLDMTDF